MTTARPHLHCSCQYPPGGGALDLCDAHRCDLERRLATVWEKHRGQIGKLRDQHATAIGVMERHLDQERASVVEGLVSISSESAPIRIARALAWAAVGCMAGLWIGLWVL